MKEIIYKLIRLTNENIITWERTITHCSGSEQCPVYCGKSKELPYEISLIVGTTHVLIIADKAIGEHQNELQELLISIRRELSLTPKFDKFVKELEKFKI